jgi:hypothetical protein
MTGDPLAEEMSAALAPAIDSIVGGGEGAMVTKWVALVETVDVSGDRGMWTLTSEPIKAWDTVGMLQHALYVQQVHVMGDVGGDD